MSNVSKRRREGARTRVKALGDHKEFLKRITKSLYYGELPTLPCLSLPVTEISAELFSEAQRGRSLKRLHLDAAAEVTRNACVSPCSLVLAILYLERLKTCNPEYLAKVAPNELFLVSLMVSNKFLQDDGEEDEVFCDEWAASGGLNITDLKHLEKNFLNAIDWHVYVSEKSFESGLSWLERQVALKQANLRGFFTYADLAASTANLGIGDMLKSFSSVCLAMTVGYITSLLAVVASTMLISHSLLPSLHQHSTASSPATVDSNNNLITPISDTILPNEANASSNHTVDDSELEDALWALEKSFTTQSEINKVICCSHWWKLNEKPRHKKMEWLEGVLLSSLRREPHESWWQGTSVFNWLYQFSLITPLQKWLDKLDQWSSLVGIDILNYTQQSFHVADKCVYPVEHHGTFPDRGNKCKNRWLNLGKFNSFMVSVSDR